MQIETSDGVHLRSHALYVQTQGGLGVLAGPGTQAQGQLYNGNASLRFESLAIPDKKEVRELCRELPAQALLGLEDFLLRGALTHKWALPNIEGHVVKKRLQCTSFNALLCKHDDFLLRRRL